MKKRPVKHKTALIIAITAALLVGCTSYYERDESRLRGEPSFALDPTEQSPVMMAYLDFLLNNADFHECFISNGQTPFLFASFADYLCGEDDITIEVKRIAVVDMDSDGIMELVLSMKHPLSASVREIYLVLTCDDGELYGITFTDRSFSNLMKDGTFFSSAVSPGHWGVMSLLYSSGVFWLEETRSPNYYEFYEEFCSFVEEQQLKEEAVWFPYNAETIAEDLAAAWESNNEYEERRSTTMEDEKSYLQKNIEDWELYLSDAEPYPPRKCVIDQTYVITQNPNVESIVLETNERVLWILEQRGDYINRDADGMVHYDGILTYKKHGDYEELYDGDRLVRRDGHEFYDEIEGIVAYSLYYDDEERLIFADIIQYRHPSYCIYFYNDIVVRLAEGEFFDQTIHEILNDFMLNAIRLCTENAY